MDLEVKRFEAPTLAEALKVVKKEFGPEAVILSTKNKKSALGLMNRSSVEVTAAIPADQLRKKQLAEQRLTESQREAMIHEPSQKVRKAYDVISGARAARELKESRRLSQYSASSSQNLFKESQETYKSKKTEPEIHQTVQNQKQIFAQKKYIDIQDDDSPAVFASSMAQDEAEFSFSNRNSRASSVTEKTYQSQNSFQTQNTRAHQMVDGIFARCISRMVEAGVDQELIKGIGDELKAIMIREHITREDLLQMHLAKILMSRIRVGRPLSERLSVPTTPRVICFLGPTGVGKTTTIAKIAAELVINQKRPVVLATSDTYKIAAVEQLQAYANILRIPLEVCPNPESLKEISFRGHGDEVILVDTPGYGPKDENKMKELMNTLEGIRMEKHLCVSATTRDIDLKEIVKRYGAFEPNYLVVTKLDESSVYGNVFNISAKSRIPLSYFTMGQRVPEDMEVATRERLADLILNIAGGI